VEFDPGIILAEVIGRLKLRQTKPGVGSLGLSFVIVALMVVAYGASQRDFRWLAFQSRAREQFETCGISISFSPAAMRHW
jgi:hypothetical protein